MDSQWPPCRFWLFLNSLTYRYIKSPQPSTLPLNEILITSGGSGSTTPPYVISAVQALTTRIADDGGVIRWDFYNINRTPLYRSEACLVFINRYPDEGFDSMGLQDDFSDHLVDNVASNRSNTIVIIHSAGKSSMFVVSKSVALCLQLRVLTKLKRHSFGWPLGWSSQCD